MATLGKFHRVSGSVSRATDSIWHTANLEDGDPYEDESSWFRDKRNMYKTHGYSNRNSDLMTLVPGWDEAKRKGWKSLGGGAVAGPLAYRGSGDNFEFIGAKHVSPDEFHWDNIPQRWIRYSLGEGGMADPYVMHAETFKDASNDRNLRGWNLYRSEYDPESGQFSKTFNDDYPSNRHGSGPSAYVDVFDGYKGSQGHFDWVREQAEKNEKKLRGEL